MKRPLMKAYLNACLLCSPHHLPFGRHATLLWLHQRSKSRLLTTEDQFYSMNCMHRQIKEVYRPDFTGTCFAADRGFWSPNNSLLSSCICFQLGFPEEGEEKCRSLPTSEASCSSSPSSLSSLIPSYNLCLELRRPKEISHTANG